MDRARTAFTKTKNKAFPSGKPKPGSWSSVGPSQALYPFEQFRNSGLYVPNEYIAGGRTTDSASPELSARRLPRVDRSRRRGRVADQERPRPIREVDIPRRPVGINAAGYRRVDPNDPTGNTVYVGTGEANICGSGCVAGTASTSRSTAADLDRCSARQSSPEGRRPIAVEPGDPNTIYVGTTTALRGMSSVCCSGVTRPVPGAPSGASTSRRTAGRRGRSSTTGRPTSPIARATRPSSRTAASARRAGSRQVRSTRPTPTPSTLVVRARHLALERRRRDMDADQAVDQRGGRSSRVRPMAVTTLPSGRTRMYVTRATTAEHVAASSAATTSQPVRQRSPT